MDFQDDDIFAGNVFKRVIECYGSAVKAHRIYLLLRFGELEQPSLLCPGLQEEAQAQHRQYDAEFIHYSGQRILASV